MIFKKKNKKYMKEACYIFLDVDGVLNNKKHYKKQHKKYGGRFFMQNMPFNPRSLRNLKRIINKTGANIVLTSSWRLSKNCMVVLEARLCEYGMKILDATSYLNDRGNEIIDWLVANTSDSVNYIIIDDEIYDFENCFDDNSIVKINQNNGLTFRSMLESVRKLKRQIT